MKFIKWILIALGILAVIATLVSLLPTDYWLVRTIDLVREPMTYFLALVFAIAVLVPTGRRGLLALLFGVAILVNIWRIWPYSGLAPTDIDLVAQTAEDRCFTALSVNVKVKNTKFDQVAAQVREVNPDVLFLMETDQKWIDALEPTLANYSSVTRHPQPEAFGLVFATNLPTSKVNVVEDSNRNTPTVYATLQPVGNRSVEFIGLHPKPPLPGWNTEERDENIITAATQTPDRLPDALVMGDFNDVPWSPTTSKFRERGDWDDPRIGRGTFATFPSNLLLLGWPLDHMMVKGDLEVERFEVMPDNGSDHRAVLGRLCLPQG
ncbi:endonuclease/exonuclease/phosphatase family protein [Erythrobacter sp.]|jgi:endonuclease/exonuclease/phosphatase (EEP) superfamily protein YafD|uniref:endonuclease/exonuclease/phosphatase family protein n=1 Tax=Erythrobacter sp. TaxID=1042 RepID=UPI002E9E9D35|nr:endonuclease/exonuclease/phosphatase family protein [Erythrobacter sp.]